MMDPNLKSKTAARVKFIVPKREISARRTEQNGIGHWPCAGPRPKYSDEFYTPPKFVTSFGEFDLDPCAGPMRHAKTNWKNRGLEREWFGRVWLNPPYSDIYAWLEKFAQHGNGMCLLNARCETGWFQRLAAISDGIFFPRHRIQFLSGGRPPVGSVLFALGRSNMAALKCSDIPGIVVSVAASRVEAKG